MGYVAGERGVEPDQCWSINISPMVPVGVQISVAHNSLTPTH